MVCNPLSDDSLKARVNTHRRKHMVAPSECEDSNNARLQVLTEEQLSLFREDFSAVDADKDGQISEHEIAIMVREQLGLAPTKRQLNALMRWVLRRSRQCCFEFCLCLCRQFDVDKVSAPIVFRPQSVCCI